MIGGAKRDRTADLNTASVALSQLSYSPLMRCEILLIESHPVKVKTVEKAPKAGDNPFPIA